MTETSKVWRWERDDYVLSSDRSIIPVETLIAAWASDLLPWAKAPDSDTMRMLIDNSLFLCIYAKQGDELQLVGSCRVITDYVTIGYLADVYVLESHQGKGLAGWMLTCLGEIIDQWPLLRRFILLTVSPEAARLYNRVLGMRNWLDMESPELLVLQRKGRGVINQVSL